MKISLLSLPGINESDENLFPLGIGYLVSVLKQSHEVNAFHYNLFKNAKIDISERITSFKPDIVGLSCTTFNRKFVREIIHQIKAINKNIIIIVGGVHASFCWEQIIKVYNADIVVIGEGEDTILNLVNALEKKMPLKSINGIAYKDNDRVILNSPAGVIHNLDELPMPDHSFAREYIEKAQMGFIITSRGCPVRCTFCSTSSFWGQKVRMNSPKRVVDEMEMLIANFKIKKIFFHDDTFNLGIPRVEAICNEIINRKINIIWGCSCRVNPVSEKMISIMVEAGCRHICWGIESGSPEMLKKIEKKITTEQIRNAFELSKKYSSIMSTGAFAMVGNPGESEKTIQETSNFLNTLPITDCPSTAILYVLPGTMLYENLKKSGHIKDEDWVKYDTIPIYTMENSYHTLSKWSNLVTQSVNNRIHFDQQKHFWYKTLKTSDINVDDKTSSTQKILNKIFNAIFHPQKIYMKIKKEINKFFVGKISF